MEKECLIIEGPLIDEHYMPNIRSMGKYFYECLKKRDPSEILYIDAVTDRFLTCGKLLENTVKGVEVLKHLGIKKDDVITIISENTLEYIIPISAAFCMGVIVNPLNPAYSIGELRHALLISKPKLVICSFGALENIEKLKEEFNFIQTVLLIGNVNKYGSNTSVARLDKLLENMWIDNYSGFDPVLLEESTQGALILMSSGTTGLPKGVSLTHENIKASVTYTGNPKYCGFNQGDSMVAVLPCFHIFGLLIYFTALYLETKIIILEKFQLDVYMKAIERYKVNKLQIVPPLVSLFSDINIVKNYDLSSVKDILVGGAPIANEAVQHVILRLPHVNFREVYGLTEMSACAFVRKFPRKENCVGSLVPHIKVKVLDPASGKFLGSMEVGELCFKGPMVMKGYIGINKDINIIDNDGYYHSGDLGYYDEHGLLYIVDRIKELIKYKGFQVSPVELELILITHPCIKDCAVVGIPDDAAGQLPLAFVVRQVDMDVSEQEIEEFVADRISVHKRLYGGVRFVDQILKSASGKILRRKLEELI